MIAMKRAAPAALAVLLGLAAAAAAQNEVRPEKPLIRPGRPRLTLPSETLWSVDGGLWVSRDNDINRLLTNSVVDSNARVADTIVHAGADLDAAPRWGDALTADISYSYDRYDFQNHPAFSYYDNSLSADLYPRVAPAWRADLGADLDWVSDSGGSVSNSRTGRLGAVWDGPERLRAKAGYEYSLDRVTVDTNRNAAGHALYLTLLRPLPARQYGFLGYRYRTVSTAGANYAYKSHSLYAGLIQPWTERLRATWVVTVADKAYDNRDTRFLTTRRDRLYSLSFKPAVVLIPGVRAEARVALLRGDSNVNAKSYWDQVYSLGLRGSF